MTHSIRTLTIIDVQGNTQNWFMPYWLISISFQYAQAMLKRGQPMRINYLKEYVDNHMDKNMFPPSLRLMPRPSDLIKSEHQYHLTMNYRHLQPIYTKNLGKIVVCNS